MELQLLQQPFHQVETHGVMAAQQERWTIEGPALFSFFAELLSVGTRHRRIAKEVVGNREVDELEEQQRRAAAEV